VFEFDKRELLLQSLGNALRLLHVHRGLISLLLLAAAILLGAVFVVKSGWARKLTLLNRMVMRSRVVLLDVHVCILLSSSSVNCICNQLSLLLWRKHAVCLTDASICLWLVELNLLRQVVLSYMIGLCAAIRRLINIAAVMMVVDAWKLLGVVVVEGQAKLL
jgi:hypothetical protein